MPAASAGGASTPLSGGMAMKKSGIAGLVFAGATAVALAFGTTQAFAAPSAADTAGARACTDRYCRNVVCQPFTGYCDELRGLCVCTG